MQQHGPGAFFFLMSAFAETLKVEWKNAGIIVCTVQSTIGEKLASGKEKLCDHLPKDYLLRTLTAAETLQCLYIDDGAFIFASWADLTRVLELVYKHFGRLGLEMHIGGGTSPSKMECVFFPPPGFFDSHLPALPQESINVTNALGDGFDDILTADARRAEQKTRAQREQEGDLYNTLKETQPITVDDGFVTFCWHFKYLRSFVSSSLRDNFDIKN
jgi:hypothetical protein